MIYMSDYEKIEFLLKQQYFSNLKSLSQYSIKTKRIDVIRYIKYKSVFYLIQQQSQELENFEIDEKLEPWINEKYCDKKMLNIIENFEYNDDIVKAYITTYTIIKNYLNYEINKPTDENISYFFIPNIERIDLDSTHTAHKLIQKIIIELTGINKASLKAKSKNEFMSLLDLPVGVKFMKAPKKFKKYNLNIQLLKNDTKKDLLVLNDFKNYLELPDFIDHTILDNRVLKNTLFVEGISGSGKTILAQAIACNIIIQ